MYLLIQNHNMSAVLLSISLLISNCTSSKDRKVDLDDIAREAAGDREIIVQQPDSDKALLSKHNRQHWVELRRDAKNSSQKIYATLATGEWPAAEKEARSLLLKEPKNAAGLVVLATSLAMQQKYALAAFYARAHEKFHGTTSETLNLQGLSLLSSSKSRMNDYQKAASLFQQAFQAEGAQVAAGLNLGHLYLELGDASNAAEIFDEVKQRCKQCVPALVGAGVANSRLRNFAAARRDFETVLKLHKHHAQALYRLALIAHWGEKNPKKAKKYLDELVTYAPENEVMIRQKSEALVRALDAEDDTSKVADIKDDDVGMPAIDDDEPLDRSSSDEDPIPASMDDTDL